MEKHKTNFSENRKIASKSTIVGNNENIMSVDKLVSEESNTFFQNAFKTLNITGTLYLKNDAT